jgi:dTDP-4-dehydrorhamnose reductase
LSTDFVFDGEKGNYSETDEVNPLSIYAQSKVLSEKILLNSEYQNWSIVRTIIVFGIGHHLSRSNIVLWARDALMKGEVLTIVDDQFRAPTWADDLAKGCMLIIEKNKTGVFHISGPETFSIVELVQKIARFKKVSTSSVVPTSSQSLNQKAKRPPKTGFNLAKARNELGYSPHSFEKALELLEKELNSGAYKV